MKRSIPFLTIFIFEGHTLLNKLGDWRDLYTAAINTGEEILPPINLLRHLAAARNSMDVDTDDWKIVLAVLTGIPDQISYINTALGGVKDESIPVGLFESGFYKRRKVRES